jgi:hypothetical protein
VLRDLEYENDPLWEAVHGAQRKHQNKSNTSMAAVLVLGIGLIVAARLWFPDDGAAASAPSVARTSPSSGAPNRNPEVAVGVGTGGGIYRWLQDIMPGEKPVVARDDFRAGLANWVDGGGRGAAWSTNDGSLRPGRLHFWKPTLKTVNYEVAFQGSIEKKAISWAFRAQDASNYYATKIILHKPGDPSGASVQRIVVEHAKAMPLVELPLPLRLEKDQAYQIAFAVRGNRFSTLLNGQLIDEWTDSRHKAGGVGFYSDEGESSRISWVNFAERKSLFGRLFASAFFLPPGADLE